MFWLEECRNEVICIVFDTWMSNVTSYRSRAVMLQLVIIKGTNTTSNNAVLPSFGKYAIWGVLCDRFVLAKI
jgi:hypothetical protein